MFSPVATDTDRCKLGSSKEAEDNTVVMAFPRMTIGPLPVQSPGVFYCHTLTFAGGTGTTRDCKEAPSADGEDKAGPAELPCTPASIGVALRGRPSTTKPCCPSCSQYELQAVGGLNSNPNAHHDLGQRQGETGNAAVRMSTLTEPFTASEVGLGRARNQLQAAWLHSANRPPWSSTLCTLCLNSNNRLIFTLKTKIGKDIFFLFRYFFQSGFASPLFKTR